VLPADVPADGPRAEAVAVGVDAGPDGRGLDEETAQWLAALNDSGQVREQALGQLHKMLLRIARVELRRRGGQHPVTGPELDDLAHQAADDALLTITTKLGHFRGESRFTIWAYKFVILEVSAKLGRHFWQQPTVAFDADDWDRLPDRFGMQPDEHARRRDLIAAVRRAVDEELTERQRQVFVAIVVNGVPLDALVVQLRSSRNAIYKTMFDARRKLRAALAANGYLTTSTQEARGQEAGPEDVGAVRRS
jgi:RNA polymerase sigma-70 factor, ECF subfamily